MKIIKSLTITAAAAALLCACAGKPADLNAAREEIDRTFAQIVEDTTLTMDGKIEKLKPFLAGEYEKHRDDSLGLELFVAYITNFCEADEAVALYDAASPLVRDNEFVKTKVEAFRNEAGTGVGKQYKEVEGEDAVSGKPLSLSSFIGGDKPTLVDFWASWCVPCRNEIAGHLLPLSKEGKVNIVGVAVWENSVEDTRGAMSELGITWPVIYAGGRADSPTVGYGIVGIPTLVLIAPDGSILGRGHSVEDLPL